MVKMHWIDYAITLVPFVVVLIVSWNTRRHMKSVADFMAASRCAGRYLVCNAAGEAAFGAVSAVAIFEYVYKTGFAITWWGKLSTPVSLLITLTGFVIYRYRESRVMTMAQFFEIRYGKGFRILAGMLGFLSGLINYGIFPAVGARFFVNYCGLPQTVSFLGLAMPTFGLLMAVFISIALFLTLVGGQLTIMISDCLEGLLSGMLYLVVAIALLCIFSWSEMYEALAAAPKGQSMLNPFDTAQAKDFNIWYVLIGIVGSVYGYMSWQGGHAFRSCAASPHEAKMGNILGSWRGYARGVMITLLGVCAFTYLNDADFATGAREVQESLKLIPEPQIQSQMRVPVALAHFLPVGAKGAFACIMLFAMLACDGSYMHSWGSIFVQDVVLPFRKKPFTASQHIRFLRWSIVGVGVFAFLFGLFFPQTDYILMFFAITGTIFLGGSGCAVLGGLYWKKGTNAGAWVSMLVGSTLATGAIVLGMFPFGKLPLSINAPEAVAVTVNTKPAQRVGDHWEYTLKFTRMEEWQPADIVIHNKAGASGEAVVTKSVLHYAFGAKTPDKAPVAVASVPIEVKPASMTVVPKPTGLASAVFLALRDINGQWLWFISMCTATVLYVVISLLTCKEDFNMDRMLHRGKYAVDLKPGQPGATATRKFTWGGLLGFDHEFTLGDKILSCSVFIWSMLWFFVFIIVSIWCVFRPWQLETWGHYWYYYTILLPLVIGVITTVWFTWGGVRDLRRLFVSLRTVKRSEFDDGMVVGHRNLDEEEELPDDEQAVDAKPKIPNVP